MDLFLSFINRCRGNPAPYEILLNRAITTYASDYDNPVVNAFWSHGLRGWPSPMWVTAWRFGKLPEGGLSYNYRDKYFEHGISVAHVVDTGAGAGAAYSMFFGNRQVYWVKGWLREDYTGSDGEPLLVGAMLTRSPRRRAVQA